MQMKVKHGLSRFRIHIENGAIAFLRHAELFGELPRDFKHVCDKRGVIRRHIVQCRDVLSWADQNMDRCLGMDVVKRNNAIIFIYHPGGHFTIRNFAKKTGIH